MSEKRLCVYTVFTQSRPALAGVLIGGQSKVWEMCCPGTGSKVAVYDANRAKLVRLLNAAAASGTPIVMAGVKEHLSYLPDLVLDDYIKVYDSNLGCTFRVDSLATVQSNLPVILRQLQQMPLKPWHQTLARAAVIYHNLERRGVKEMSGSGAPIIYPSWSLRTFSGRSKSMGTNIQGLAAGDPLHSLHGLDSDLYLQFDWVAADLVPALVFSADARLRQAFLDSDPYTLVRDWLNRGESTFSRAECKLLLLKAINSLDTENKTLRAIYPQLWEWLGAARSSLEARGYLESILGRRFYLAKARNMLAVVNGVLQGSVAHAMQAALVRVWAAASDHLLLENHDSITLAAPHDAKVVGSLIERVLPVMRRPLAGILPDDPTFVVRVSVGKSYKQWEPLWVVRPNGQRQKVVGGHDQG